MPISATINFNNDPTCRSDNEQFLNEVGNYVNTTEAQSVSAWISWMKAIRLEKLLRDMREIDFRKSTAIAELKALTNSVEELISSNRGGTKGIHGFIGERAQVYLKNAWSIVKGSVKVCELIDDNGMTDYLENGIPIQQKACRSGGLLGIDHMMKHKAKYPQFCGKYQMPKDFYKTYNRLKNLNQHQAGKLGRHEWAMWNEIQAAEHAGIEIEPMLVSYDEIQQNNIFYCIEKHKAGIESEVKNQATEVIKRNSPSLKGGIFCSATSAVVEGSLSGVAEVINKHGEGKRIRDYDSADVRDIANATAIGSVKGAVRGAVVYATENYTNIPGIAAGAAVSVAFESVGSVSKCCSGKIDVNECITEIGKSVLVASAGAVGAKIGKEIIDIPIIGEAVGGFVFSFVAEKVFLVVYKVLENNRARVTVAQAS